MTKLLAIFAFALITSGCAVYKMDVQQGNSITNEAVSQLQKGMSKSEVASLLGYPLMHDNFRSNRWDYIYYAGKGRKFSKEQSLTLFFANDQLVKVTQ